MLPNENNIPKVSVIIPTYNRAHLIGRALKSVLNQTYQNFEIIVIDDGSTDNTEEIVKSFSGERIRYIRHKVNKGYPAALNTGIKAAKGKYIAFQDSDDEWFPEKLEKQMKIFEYAPPEVGVVYTGYWRIYEDDKKIYTPREEVTPKEGDVHKELLKRNFVGAPTMIIRKECFERVGMFDEDLPQLQDWELLIRLSKYYNFKCVDEPLLTSYYILDSMSSNKESFIKSIEYILSKHFEEFAKDKKLLSKYYFIIGLNICLNLSDNFKEGRNYILKGVKVNAFNIKFLLTALLSFFGPDVFKNVIKIYLEIKSKE